MSDGEVCWVCGQIENAAKAEEVALLLPFVGVAANGVCMRCGLEVLHREDPGYLARQSRFLGAKHS